MASNNTTINYGPITHDQTVAVAVAIAVFGLWSTFGNLLTLVAILTNKNMKTKSNMFILSLSLSDLLSGVVASPLWLYRKTWGFNPWEWGQFACKLYWFTDEATSYCTALHIAAFAIWRFIGVKYPHKIRIIKRKFVIIWVLILWTLAMVFGGIYSSQFRSMVKPQDGSIYSNWPMCSLDYRNNGLKRYLAYYYFSSSTLLITPMAILFAASALIAFELLSNKTVKNELRKAKEKRAVTQLALIALTFFFGYIPTIWYNTWTTSARNKPKTLDYWLNVLAYLFLRFSECINPIMYNISSKRMRDASKKAISQFCWCWNNPKLRSRNRVQPLSIINS